jgi:hypothetical protein
MFGRDSISAGLSSEIPSQDNGQVEPVRIAGTRYEPRPNAVRAFVTARHEAISVIFHEKKRQSRGIAPAVAALRCLNFDFKVIGMIDMKKNV